MNLPLAQWLARLLTEDALPASTASRTVQRELTPLVESGLVRWRRSGKGAVYEPSDREALRAMITGRFPHLLETNQDCPSLPPRAGAVARYRDSKKAQAGEGGFPLQLRAHGPALWSDGVAQLDVQSATLTYGMSAILVREDDSWKTAHPLYLVENLELFTASRLLPGIGEGGSVLYYGGWVAEKIIKWLAFSPRCPALILMADYDPVGLKNYQKLKAQVPQVRLYIPDNLDALFASYGTANRLTPQNRALLRGLLDEADGDCRRVIGLILERGEVLDQEILLQGLRHQVTVDNSTA